MKERSSESANDRDGASVSVRRHLAERSEVAKCSNKLNASGDDVRSYSQ